MRTKSCKNRDQWSKEKTAKSNGYKDEKIMSTENGNDSEPQPTLLGNC